MATPDSTLSTLAQIRTKVRRLTRSMTEAQLTTQQIDDYINTFVLYDFPEHLRLFNLQTTFTFFTEPYIDTYESNDTSTSVFYNFKNKYLNIMPPIYIAGRNAMFMESREQFFGIYPMNNSIQSIGAAGDGVQTQFSGYVANQQAITFPFVNNNPQGTILLRDNVLFSSIDINNNSLALIDYPTSSTSGALGLPGEPQVQPSPYGSINYLTGQFTVIFPTAPAAGAGINSQTIQLQPNLPQSMLFYDGKFTMRPVPDQAYRVQMQVAMRPTELLSSSQSPELSEWWAYVAYGATKKVFEDRMDLESVQLIMPEFKKQEALINRRTIVQQTSQRTSTIYQNEVGGVSSTNSGYGWGNGTGN